MLELIKYVVDQFAENKDEVEIRTEEKENSIVVTVVLAASDMGKVIGKQGKIAKALRTLVRAATPRNSKKYIVEIQEKGACAPADTDAEDAEY
ncbi:MAG: KH domain-containing protein [Clostridia bacterium]|nr:KH domain-containing protein [Clostridia bacterium]